MIKKIWFIALLAGINICALAQNITDLKAKDFDSKIKNDSKAVLIDVRTADEFSQGHLDKANNWDWKNGDFKNKVSNLNKTEPILLYCLSGGRSDLAAKYLQEQGFKNISVMQGGILKWRADNLPEVNEVASAKGMSLADYNKLLKSDKLVLVDFYADWCAPCMEMKPYLERIASEKKNTVDVVRINIDQNPVLAKALGVSELPVLHLYKNEKVIWEKRSLATEKEILKALK